MVGVVENKTFKYERVFAEIKRLSSAGLGGPELLKWTAERLRKVVPLRSIFEKAGVSSRRQMVQRLYLEDLMPGVLGD
jgi:hypothetical protein